MNNATLNKRKAKIIVDKVMHQPESVLKECEIILKIGSNTRFFFRNKKSYDKFVESSLPNISILGERTIIRNL